MMKLAFQVFLLAFIIVATSARRGGIQKKAYQDLEEEGKKIIDTVEHDSKGELEHCVNWVKHSNSELIKNLQKHGGIHLFSDKFPACPVKHKEVKGGRKGAQRPGLHEGGVVSTSTDAMLMCNIMGKLMEFGRLPPNTTAMRESGLIFLDVGACEGAELMIGHQVGFDTYSFEPRPNAYNLLMNDWRTELAESSRAHIVQAAITDMMPSVANVTIYNAEDKSSLYKEVLDREKALVKREKKRGRLEKEPVPGMSLDYAMRNTWRKQTVAFIKANVEGHEYEVLEGAYGILQQDKPALFFHYNPQLMPGGGAQIFCYLKALGYDCGYLTQKKRGVGEIICTHPEQYHYRPSIKGGKGNKGKKTSKLLRA